MKTTEKNYEIDMCSGPILGKMLSFSLPLMCSSMLQLLFNAADIVVVGRFAGENSLAAVGSNTALIGLLTNLFIGLSIGANVLAARYYGAKKDKDLKETVHTSMFLSILSGILLTVIGVAGARQILIIMQTPEEILGLAVIYLRIYFLGMTATMIYNFGSAVLRAVGDTKRPLWYLAVAGVINVALKLILVIEFKMDVAGVAAATAISQCVSAFLIMRCMVKTEGAMKLVIKNMRFHKDKLLKILQIGLPAGFQGILFSLSNVIIQSSINSFGPVVMAGNSAAANLESFVYFAMNAFYQAAISFTSQNMGAGKYNRIMKILVRAQICVIVTGLVLGNLVVIFGSQLLRLYSTKAAVISAGMVRLSIISRTYAICGVMDVMVGALRGIGYSVMPMIVSLLGACVFRIIWIGTLFQVPKYHTIAVIYDSYPVSWAVTTAVHIICFAWAMKHIKKKIREKEELTIYEKE